MPKVKSDRNCLIFYTLHVCEYPLNSSNTGSIESNEKTIYILRFISLNSLTELTDLDLSGIQISYLTPLNNYQIKDISAVSSLSELTYLNLENNRIQDIRPLISLNKLTVLSIEKPARDFYIMKSLEKPIQYRTQLRSY
ncbi:hypothetical protein [Chamaesiphon sp.]|uniref:hypothetical protein n=1 Tax=Chamaesiphon sp. TaxID=2814140 RepID=UPI0035937CD0